jgi:hypothetical protein
MNIPKNGKQDRKKMKPKELLRKTVRFMFIVLAALWIMFEEWVWDSIMAVMEKIGRLKMINRIESVLIKQNPYLLLSLFLFPFFIMIPAKIYGLYLVAEGKTWRGISIFVLAKGFITAFITRLFYISRDKLMQIRAFAVSYSWIKEKKDWLYAELNKIPAWQAARKGVAGVKRFVKEKVRPLKTHSSFIAKIKKLTLKMKRRKIP